LALKVYPLAKTQKVGGGLVNFGLAHFDFDSRPTASWQRNDDIDLFTRIIPPGVDPPTEWLTVDA